MALVVGEPMAIRDLDVSGFPVTWEELPALLTMDEALRADAAAIHESRLGNLSTSGRVRTGDVDEALATADVVAEGEFETGFVEHAYIEPEAGWARRRATGIEIRTCTQTPYMDRDDLAKILALAPETCASCRPRPAAASAASSICRSSPSSRSRPGISIGRCAGLQRAPNR